MFVLIDKVKKRCWESRSKVALSEESGVSYARLNYYSRKEWYETDEILFCRGEFIKSAQGGYRKNAFKK